MFSWPVPTQISYQDQQITIDADNKIDDILQTAILKSFERKWLCSSFKFEPRDPINDDT